MRMWAVQARIEHRSPEGWEGSRKLPTFYLHPSVQGTLTAEQATKVARDIVQQVFEATVQSVGALATVGMIVPHIHVQEVDIN